MPRTNRNTLKEYFKRGSMPNQKHFYELIDSMVNISDDGIDKNPDDGLRLAPSKENSPVISLFTNIQVTIANSISYVKGKMNRYYRFIQTVVSR